MTIPGLTLCAVTIERARIEQFLQHHEPIARDPRLEWLIFCPERDRAALTAEWTARYHAVRFFADDAVPGLNERRNRLLAAAAGGAIIFLDDDAYLAQPAAMLEPLLRVAAEHPWVLLSRVDWGAEKRRMLPKSFRVGEVGTGIEWNQVFRVEILRKVGGWDPRFGPGAAWCSGEAFVLMFTLSKAGCQQHHAPELAIAHPPQAVRRDLSNLGKFRGYRRAMGTMLAYLRPRMSAREYATWLARLTLGPIAGALLALARRDIPTAALRACTPVDILAGLRAFRTPASQAAAGPFPTKIPER